MPEPRVLFQGCPFAKDDALIGLAFVIPALSILFEFTVVERFVKQAIVRLEILLQGLNEPGQVDISRANNAEAPV